MSDPRPPDAPDPAGPRSDNDNPLEVLAQAGSPPADPPERRATKRSPAAPTRAARPADEAGPPTEPVAAPPRTARTLTKPRRTPKPTPDAAKGASATLSGFLLVLAAVAIGAVLLTQGYTRESGLVTSPETAPTEATTTLVPNSPVGNLPGLPSGTNAPLRPPSAIVVKVGKAGAPEGVATADTQKLKNAGYSQASAFDANQAVPSSVVYYQPGFQGEAGEVAKVFKIPDTGVKAMPNPPPEPLGTPPADVMVLLGPEARSETA
jgi:hypothetical protein